MVELKEISSITVKLFQNNKIIHYALNKVFHIMLY